MHKVIDIIYRVRVKEKFYEREVIDGARTSVGAQLNSKQRIILGLTMYNAAACVYVSKAKLLYSLSARFWSTVRKCVPKSSLFLLYRHKNNTSKYSESFLLMLEKKMMLNFAKVRWGARMLLAFFLFTLRCISFCLFFISYRVFDLSSWRKTLLNKKNFSEAKMRFFSYELKIFSNPRKKIAYQKSENSLAKKSLAIVWHLRLYQTFSQNFF